MKLIKKNLLFVLLFTLILSVSNSTVFANNNNDYLQKGMTEQQKALHEYNTKMYNQIKGEVDAQSAKINEQVQNQQSSTSFDDIHKEAGQIKSIANVIIVVAPILGLGFIIIIGIFVIKYLSKNKVRR